MEHLEQRELLAGDVLVAPADGMFADGANDVWISGAEGEGTPLSQAEARIVEDLPASTTGPTNRPAVTEVSPGDTFRLEVWLRDLRTDDGDGRADLDNFGVYASWVDVGFDANAFSIPDGTSNNALGKPNLPLPVSFRNANFLAILSTVPPVVDSAQYRYSNAPSADLSIPGVVNNLGSFMEGTSPIGQYGYFQLDMKFQVESLAAVNDQFAVLAGVPNQTLDVLDNDVLVRGAKTFAMHPHDQFGGVDTFYETLVFGNTGFTSSGPAPEGGVVPTDRIQVISDTVNVVNPGSLRLERVTQGTKGSVVMGSDGSLRYTPNPGVSGPEEDTFSYTISDGLGNEKTASVTVSIIAVSTFVVNSTGDAADTNLGDGVCSTGGTVGGSPECTLRAAIQQANALSGSLNLIHFDIPGAGPHVIQPATPLPTITDAVVIDGTTEPDFVSTPVIELNGTNAGTTTSGLRITGGGSTVKGLAINRFGVYGIDISGGGDNQVLGNFLGTNPAGTAALGNLNYGMSITSADNRVGGPGPGERNVVSGNQRGGVRIAGATATGNVVQGNYVGTDVTGTLDLGNREAGVAISGSNNLVGGVLEGEGNLLSGNNQQGLALFGTGNTAHGNLIGTNASGTGKIANSDYGIAIYASLNQIGGAGAGEGNVISGNRYGGVLIRGTTTSANKVQGNRIGTDPTGMISVGNSLTGIALDASFGNLIGGTREEGNQLSGNGREGVSLYRPGNLVMGNLIGTDATGAGPLGNGGWGVYIVTYDSQVGGIVAGQDGNVISANALGGIQLFGSGAHDNTFHANLIGLNLDGTQALANQGQGIFVNRGYLNEIGGPGGAGNVISGNTKEGVWISGGPATNNKLWGNLIGTNAAGTGAVGNILSGVRLTALGNFIGGAQQGEGNVISGNRQHGVLLQGDTSSRNSVRGNRIGMDAAASLAIPNALHGVAISGFQNTIGGVLTGEGNTVGRNSLTGVSVIGDAALRNAIQGNRFVRNVGIGIDLVGSSGPTANDVDDPDAGPNRLQNFPVINRAVLSGGNLAITYAVPTAVANATYPLTVEFFVADADNQEGDAFVGRDAYAAPGAKSVTIPACCIPVGSRLVATATDSQGNTSEFSFPSFVTTATLLAAGGEADAGGDVSSISSVELATVVDAALARWSAAGISASQLANLASLEFVVADLPDGVLGTAADGRITLDPNAAGYGWFVDPTPDADEEYEFLTGDAGRARTDTAAVDRADLLTAVLHEMGHVLGLSDLHDDGSLDDLMHASLEAGVRKLH